MTVNWAILPITELSQVQTDWDALNDKTSLIPILDFDFWSIMLQHFGSGNELVCLCRRDGDLIASTIVEPVGKGRWETSAPDQAPLGAWMSTNSISISTLLETLANSLPGYVASLAVTRQDPDISARPSVTGKLSTLDYISTGRIYCDDGFDAYWKSRGKNLRQNLRRQRNRLSREKVQTRLRTITEYDLIGDGVDAYGRLESSGWKSESGTALHPDNAQGKFYRALFEFYGRTNESVVYEYYYNSDLVATDLCLRRGNVLTILKTTHDEQQKTTSPALLMREESIRDMLDHDGINQIEFYGKQMDWHTKWTDDFRMMYHSNYDRSVLFSWLRKLAR